MPEFRYISYAVFLMMIAFFIAVFGTGGLISIEKPSMQSGNPIDILKNTLAEFGKMFAKLLLFDAFSFAPAPFNAVLNVIFGFLAWTSMLFILYFIITFIVKLIKPFG